MVDEEDAEVGDDVDVADDGEVTTVMDDAKDTAVRRAANRPRLGC